MPLMPMLGEQRMPAAIQARAEVQASYSLGHKYNRHPHLSHFLDFDLFMKALAMETGTGLAELATAQAIHNQKYIVASATRPSRDSSQPIQDQCSIIHLCTELIFRIIDFIPPESHLDFACTCKWIADCSSSTLKRHQDAYRKYRTASDISPATVPTLLRSIFGRVDPLLAWHVRSVEIWHDRTSWLDWKPLSFDQSLHEDDIEVDSVLWKWGDDEVSEYLEDIEDQLYAMTDNGDEEVIREAHKHLEDGLDGILKMLLVAYCPRLQDVKFITPEHHDGSTLGWLRRIIRGSILHGSHWPPGLCNIRKIAVGVESDTWMSAQHEDNQLLPNRSLQIFSTLLRLPRLHSIYYNDLRRSGWNDQTDYASLALMPPYSSTVRHIFLDDCSDLPYSFRCALFQAPLALESFTLRAGDCDERLDDADTLVSGLASFQSASLHTLMFYGPYTASQIHGYRCHVYRNEELEKARQLKTVAIHIADVELDCFYHIDGEDAEMGYDQQHDFFVRWFCGTAFPMTMERLILWGKTEECYLSKSKGKFLTWIEDALIAAISSRPSSGAAFHTRGNGAEGDKVYYPKLKAVYLEDVEHAPTEPRTDRLHFKSLIKVGKEAGIDINTLTNRMPPRHMHNYPTAPNKYDLRTGPWWERRSETEDWEFDVYSGRDVPRRCGKCGMCEVCLGEYSEELWMSVDD